MKKIDIALEVLKEGGYFRKALEANYFGGETFRVRLRNAAGQVVKGIGIKTFFELQDAGKLAYRPCAASSTWPEEYVLNNEGQK